MSTYVKIETKYNHVIEVLNDGILSASEIFYKLINYSNIIHFDNSGFIILMYHPEKENDIDMTELEKLLLTYRNKKVRCIDDIDELNNIFEIIDKSNIYWFDYCGYFNTDVNKPFIVDYNGKTYQVFGAMNANSSGEYIDFQGIAEIIEILPD